MNSSVNWTQKLSSRKLWAAAAGIAAGLAMVFGLDEAVISTAAGAVVSMASVLAYIVTEGRVDAAGVQRAGRDVRSPLEEDHGND